MARGSPKSQPAVTVTPFIREGALLEIVPQPSKSEAVSLVHQLADAWSQLRGEYGETVALAINAKVHDMQFCSYETSVRERWEGNTRVIDFQCLQYLGGSHPFDTRLCVAICTGMMSTKIWSRVGMSQDGPVAKTSVSIEELSNVASPYRKVTSNSCTWMLKKLKEMIKGRFRSMQVRERGWLEVSAFGIRDESLAKYFEQLLETTISAADILHDPEANEKFSLYFKESCAIQGDLLAPAGKFQEPYSWFSSPLMVVTKSGYVEPREVLYLATSSNGLARVLGIAYDDSLVGDLPHSSVTKVARWIGRRV